MIIGLSLIIVLAILPIQVLADAASTTTILNEYTKQYENQALGYTMQVYKDMELDETIMDIRTRFVNQNTTLDIFYDDFTNSQDNYVSYINYGNRSLYDNPLFTVTSPKKIKVNGIKSNLIYYSRSKLSMVSNDKNYYACVEIPRTNKKIYTIIMKSNKPIKDFEAIINTFRFTSQTKSLPGHLQTKTIKKDLSIETEAFYKEMFSNESKLEFGIFEPKAPFDFTYLKTFEKDLDYDFPVIMRYHHVDKKFSNGNLLTSKANNKVVQLTMQTMSEVGYERDVTFDILNGEYQDYFMNYANELKSLDHPVLFRLNNEMNGDWCQYSAYHHGKDTDIYIELYKYVYNLFKDQGLDNVIFVWNPNERSFPNFAWNNYMAYYPGDEYVDVVGLTGYNTGNYYPGETWRDFESIYDPIYYEYANRFSQPLMITEFSSSSNGGDKAAWMVDMFQKIKKYDRIKLAIFWSGIDWDTNGNPARVYKIDENQTIIDTIRNGLKEIR